jgi:hypothetical protein
VCELFFAGVCFVSGRDACRALCRIVMVTQRVLLAAARCHIREHLINVMIIIADAGARRSRLPRIKIKTRKIFQTGDLWTAINTALLSLAKTALSC